MRHSLVVVALLFGALGFFSFLRMPGAENVRAVQIVTLMATGMCIGVGLTRLLMRPAKQ